MRARNEITLQFEDGTTEAVKLKVRHLIEAEDKFGKGSGGFPPLKGMVYAAWLSLDKPGNGFQSFIRKLDYVELPDEDDLGDEDEEGTPTEAASSDES